MTSVLSEPVPGLPVLPAAEFRGQLAAIRGRLHDLEPCCPPGHRAAVFDALDAIEAELLALGWWFPEDELTAHDKTVLRSLGCPA